MGKRREHRRRNKLVDGVATSACPTSPSSTSSSDFEFTVSLSPTSRTSGAANLCPADELFYKGQLLPLHPSPRISMVRSLLLASGSPSSSCSDTTASRDSSGSDSTVSGFSTESLVLGGGECDSSRPSSVTEEEADPGRAVAAHRHHDGGSHHPRHKYYSLASLATRFSSVFHRNKKDTVHNQQQNREDHHVSVSVALAQQAALDVGNGNRGESVSSAEAPNQSRISAATSGKKAAAKTGAASGSSAKEVFKKYVKKVKPLYEKLDQKLSALQQHRSSHQQQQKAASRQELRKKTFSFSVRRGDKGATERIIMSASASRKERDRLTEEEPGRGSDGGAPIYAHGSFSGNLRYLRRRQSADAAASCPSSMRSSPSHSGLLYPRPRGSCGGTGGGRAAHLGDVSPAVAIETCRFPPSSWSSMEELQSAIQGAIAHCKSTMAAGQPNQKEASTAATEQSSGAPTVSPAAAAAAT